MITSEDFVHLRRKDSPGKFATSPADNHVHLSPPYNASFVSTHPLGVIYVISMNISGTLNAFRLIKDPSLCLPHHTVSTFNQLPIPLSKAFQNQNGKQGADIRAVILDKDNCFAVPHENGVYPAYKVIYRFTHFPYVSRGLPLFHSPNL